MPIVTLDSLKNKSGNNNAGGGGGGGSDDEDEGGNEYYTGGTNNQGGGSGLAVVAPTDGNNKKDALARAIDRAKKQSKQDPGQVPPPSGRMVKITVYKNGFIVNDGPFRRLGEPANDQFAESLAQGFCPQELIQDGKPADVQLDNHSSEEYKGPTGGNGGRTATATATTTTVAFEGQGRSTGSTASAGFIVIAGSEGAGMFSLDEPNAKIRIRVNFPDGTKEILKFENHHTVRHFIHRIETMRVLSRYQILVASQGSPKPLSLTLLDQTLTDAGMVNSVVTIDPQP
jgi:UBX domain-containing protein 1